MFFDRVKETATTTGTGNFTLAGAATGFRTFSSVLTVRPTVSFTRVLGLTSTTGGTSGTTASFTPAADDLLVVFVVATACTAAGRMTDTQNLGWKLVTKRVKATSLDTLYMFVANNPAAASAMTITFDNSEDSADGHAIEIVRVAGMSRYGFDAIKQWSGEDNQAAAAAPNPVLGVAATTTNPMLGAVANATNPAGLTAPASWTELSDVGYATPTTGLEVAGRTSGETGSTITWGSSSATDNCSIVVELDVTLPKDSKYSTSYVIAAGTEWEVGRGYLSASTTLVRESVEASSNAGGLVNFSAATKDVFGNISAIDALGPGRWVRSVHCTAGTVHKVSAITRKVRVEVLGGGGGGCASGNTSFAGGGGGAGTWAERTFGITPGASISYTVGAGGIGGDGSDATNGGTGGSSTVVDPDGVTTTAPGGLGGSGANFFNGQGDGGGVATNADVECPGEHGGAGVRITPTEGVVTSNGEGGCTRYGQGGERNSATNATADHHGKGFGAGGAGVSYSGSLPNLGGRGAGGLVIFHEFT